MSVLKKDFVIPETLPRGIYGLKRDERHVELTSVTCLFGNFENQGNPFWAGDNKAILMKSSAFGPSDSLLLFFLSGSREGGPGLMIVPNCFSDRLS